MKIKKRAVLLSLAIISFLSCNTENPTQFTPDALNDTFLTLDGNTIAFKDILETHKGKTLVIDIWASWCSDCIKGMPKVKDLQQQYKEATYIFLSLDKTPQAWKRGIEKYQVEGNHYFMHSGKDSAFGKFVNIDWIPRYMVIDTQKNIKLFKAVEADDKRIIQHLQ